MNHASPSAKLALALAVAAPNSSARYINTNNSGGETGAVESASASGRAFAVVIRDGLIALDLDSAESWVPAVEQRVRDIKCHVVRVTSGGPGREHLYVLAPVGWSTDDLRSEAVLAGAPAKHVRWGGRAIRPPLSPHRQGPGGHLVSPVAIGEALALLRKRPGQRRLQPKWQALIEAGVPPGAKYVSKDGVLNRGLTIYSYAIACINADESRSFFEVNVKTCSALSGKVTEKGGDVWLGQQWDNARKWVRDHLPGGATPEVDAELAALSATSETFGWHGRAGGTDRRVFAALVAIAHLIGGAIVSSSVRTLALRAGVGRSTVSNSLRRLQADGLVTVEEESGLYQAARYALHAQNDSSRGQVSNLYRGPKHICPC